MTNTILLVSALIMVESSGNTNAISPEGKEYGPLQISAAYLADANEYEGTEYTLQDMHNPVRAIRVFHSYMERYASEDTLGRAPTYEDMARVHNGGPYGYKKESTLKYWKKVQAALQTLKEDKDE